MIEDFFPTLLFYIACIPVLWVRISMPSIKSCRTMASRSPQRGMRCDCLRH